MAKCNVVHADIRVGWEQTYNIMYRKTESKLELRLIDYESLTNYLNDVPSHRRSISVSYFTTNKQSPFQFVWWQVLLMAYVWQTQAMNDQIDAEEQFAERLVKELFLDEDAHQTFRSFIGTRSNWDELSQLSEDCHSSKAVELLLKILSTAFQKQRWVYRNKT